MQVHTETRILSLAIRKAQPNSLRAPGFRRLPGPDTVLLPVPISPVERDRVRPGFMTARSRLVGCLQRPPVSATRIATRGTTLSAVLANPPCRRLEAVRTNRSKHQTNRTEQPSRLAGLLAKWFLQFLRYGRKTISLQPAPAPNQSSGCSLLPADRLTAAPCSDLPPPLASNETTQLYASPYQLIARCCLGNFPLSNPTVHLHAQRQAVQSAIVLDLLCRLLHYHRFNPSVASAVASIRAVRCLGQQHAPRCLGCLISSYSITLSVRYGFSPSK